MRCRAADLPIPAPPMMAMEASGSAAVLRMEESGGGGSEGEMASEADYEVKTRSNFDALAAFVEIITGADGRAAARFTLPDSLTSFRLWAICARGADLYGLGEASIEATLPLMLRPSLPRFLNFGDSASLSVVLQNCAASPIEVRLACRVNDPVLALQQPISTADAGETGLLIEASGSARDEADVAARGYKLTLPAGGRHELRFGAVARSAGTARVQLCGLVMHSPHSDATSIEFPVWTPATAEAFATYGHLDGSNLPEPRLAIAQPIMPPKDCFPQFGGLQVASSIGV
jgi:alpha-2-macroglobulin